MQLLESASSGGPPSSREIITSCNKKVLQPFFSVRDILENQMRCGKIIFVMMVSMPLIASCGRAEKKIEPVGQDAAHASASVPANSAAAAGASPEALRNERLANAAKFGFTVEPGTMSSCPTTAPAVATVSWDVKEPLEEGIRVEVGSEDSDVRNVLTQNHPTGSVKTDAWVRAGTVFYLLDQKSGRELASVAIESEPCAQ